MIGHEILLHSGDSTSLVLPVESDKQQYTLRFEAVFQFDPEQLVATINQVVVDTKIAESYRVEVKSCPNEVVVYSFEVDNALNSAIVPCQGRVQPKACYFIQFTILDSIPAVVQQQSPPAESLAEFSPGQNRKFFVGSAVIIVVLILLASVFFLVKKRRGSSDDSKLITLGEYRFDLHKMELILGPERTELTGKESELLFLLYSKVNTTVNRNDILKEVWGDEGDYIGRTLDVFISRLRKKLEADPTLKIINIRGIGYKLTMEN
ncbi:winged helix-turn-helix transcriptional regulator [Maribellus sp. CM-23]|nr:winged helix-turn-helix transcriptional regulator [Maribellus sp. CM-23]